MNILKTSILLKHEEKISKFLAEKGKNHIIEYGIPNINSTFFKVLQHPAYYIRIIRNYKDDAHFLVKTKEEKDNIIKKETMSGIGNGYAVREIPLTYEQWNIFAILKKEDTNISSVYFLKEVDNSLCIEGISLNTFINNLTSSIFTEGKKYFTENDINELNKRFYA